MKEENTVNEPTKAMPYDALLGTVKFYAIINSENKFFRRKGYGGYGESWTEDLGRARIYAKPGGAKGQITWWAKQYPEYGTPRLIEITGNITAIHEQDGRVREIMDKEKEIEEKRKLTNARHNYEQAKSNYEALL
jgi:hypothetical protein